MRSHSESIIEPFYQGSNQTNCTQVNQSYSRNKRILYEFRRDKFSGCRSEVCRAVMSKKSKIYRWENALHFPLEAIEACSQRPVEFALTRPSVFFTWFLVHFEQWSANRGEIRPHHQALSLLYLVYNKLPVHRFPAEKVAAHYRRYRIYVCTEVMLRRCWSRVHRKLHKR